MLQYVGLKIFDTTRSHKLIDDIYHVGLSVSYDRVLELTKTFYEEWRQSYIIHNCFSPRILRKSIFSVWLKDNIDVNPKANFNKSSYHGTSSSIIQFRATNDEGQEFPPIPSTGNTSQDSKKLIRLPAEHTSVKDLYPAQFKNELWAPASPSYASPTEFSSNDTPVTEELQWLIIYAENLSSELFNQNVYPLDGLHIMHHRNVAYKLHQVSILFFHYHEIRLALLICKLI